MEQVEGLSKRCLTLHSRLRESADAIMGIGAIGNTEAAGDEGDFVVHNIGNGVALNVMFAFIPTGEYAKNFPQPRIRYLQNVLVNQKVNMLLPMSPYDGAIEVAFHYDSIGGRRYETRLTMTGFVFSDFKFRPVSLQANLLIVREV